MIRIRKRKNLFVSFNCVLNGATSYGNTIFHDTDLPSDMEDLMSIERRIREVYEEYTGNTLKNISVMSMQVLP